MKNTIGYSELTDRVLIGKANEEKGIWIGEKEDITNTFLNICFQYFPEGEIREIESPNLNKTNMFFNVKRDKKSIEETIKYLQEELKKNKCKKYKCKNDFAIENIDSDGMWTGEKSIIKKDTMWEIDRESEKIIQSNFIRLIDEDECWIEISEKSLEENFEEIE